MNETVIGVIMGAISGVLIFLGLWFGINGCVFGRNIREQIRDLRSRSGKVKIEEIDRNEVVYLGDASWPQLDERGLPKAAAPDTHSGLTKLGGSDNGPVFFSSEELRENPGDIEQFHRDLEARADELGCVVLVHKDINFNGISVHWEWVK